MPDNLTLFTRSIRDAVHHFGAVGDDATDNYPAALLAARHIADGGYVEWPRGRYRFSAFPEINAKTGGIVGEGSGGAPWPPGNAWGTCFRHTATGDFLTLGGTAQDLTFRDLLFWPVLAKTSGAEIKLKNRANNNKFIRIRCLFPHRFAHIEAAVWTRFEDCFVFAPAGNAAWYVSGMPDNSARNEELTLLGCSSYTPQANPSGVEPGLIGEWQPNQVIAVGQYRRTATEIWQYTDAGTTGTAPPTMPAYAKSEDRPGQKIGDGTAKCTFYCKADLAGVLIDSGGDYVNIDRFCKFLQGAHAVKTVHTLSGSTPPTRILVSKLQVDHNYGDALRFDAGSRIIVNRDTMIDSARGAPYRIGAGVDKFSIFPWFENCDSAPVNSAGLGLWKQCGGAINDDIIARGALGTFRVDLNFGVGFHMVRSGYQWGFFVESNGQFRVAQTLPSVNVVQTWNPV